MTIAFEIELEAAPKEVWKLFTNAKRLPDWNHDIVQAKKVKRQKEYKEVLELTYRTKQGEKAGYEYVVEKQAPKRYVATYDHPRSSVTCIAENEFTKLDNGNTLWRSKVTYKPKLFNWLSVRLHRSIFAYTQRLTMLRFKELIESS